MILADEGNTVFCLLMEDMLEKVLPPFVISDYVILYIPRVSDTVVCPYFLEVTCCAIRCNKMYNVMIVASGVAIIFDIRQLRGALSLPVQAVMVVGL